MFPSPLHLHPPRLSMESPVVLDATRCTRHSLPRTGCCPRPCLETRLPAPVITSPVSRRLWHQLNWMNKIATAPERIPPSPQDPPHLAVPIQSCLSLSPRHPCFPCSLSLQFYIPSHRPFYTWWYRCIRCQGPSMCPATRIPSSSERL